MSIRIFHIAGITIAVTPIETADGITRHAREQAGLQRILRHLYGEEAPGIGHHPSGQPYLCQDDKVISISHSREYVAFSCGAAAHGIDIESRRATLGTAVSRILRPDDAAPTDPLQAWTTKEAVFKAAHSAGLEPVVLSDVRLLSDTVASAGAQHFALHHIRVAPDTILTLAGI